MPARQIIEKTTPAPTKTTGLGTPPSGSGKAARQYSKTDWVFEVPPGLHFLKGDLKAVGIPFEDARGRGSISTPSGIPSAPALQKQGAAAPRDACHAP
ncbi:MAG: hypothetical protein R3F11_11230 [Verrucomicrobiales bacterium]